jgi:hypothetical protein
MWARCAKMGARAQSPINEVRALWGDHAPWAATQFVHRKEIQGRLP